MVDKKRPAINLFDEYTLSFQNIIDYHNHIEKYLHNHISTKGIRVAIIDTDPQLYVSLSIVIMNSYVLVSLEDNENVLELLKLYNVDCIISQNRNQKFEKYAQ